MSSLLGLIDTINKDYEGSIWILCQPITESAPKDLPQVYNMSKTYWTCRILSKDSNSKEYISEWFSIPYENIKNTLDHPTNGPLIMEYSRLSEEDIKELFKDTRPVFSLCKSDYREIYEWYNG